MSGPAWALLLSLLLPQAAPPEGGEDYLSWSEKQCLEVGGRMEAKGRVKGSRGWTHTERAHNYRIRATWLTPDVIRATARLQQIRRRLTDSETRALVAEAEAAGDTVVLIAIDPQEGSGVVPRDWSAFLGPEGSIDRQVRGVERPELRQVLGLAGSKEKDYAYQYFWMVFPLSDAAGVPLFGDSTSNAQLLILIKGKEGEVTWPIPDSIRKRAAAAGRP